MINYHLVSTNDTLDKWLNMAAGRELNGGDIMTPYPGRPVWTLSGSINAL